MDNSKTGHHISGQFNNELEEVRNMVLTMGGLVEHQIKLAVSAFTNDDLGMAEIAIKLADQVDALEVKIDKTCMQILAVRQPTAFDLRLLIATIKIINELEGIGDLAERIAKLSIQIFSPNANRYKKYQELEHMADLVQCMLHEALDIFARLEMQDITAITGLDKNVDREYSSVIRQLSIKMMENPKNINRMLDVISLARSLERIGDLSCNICQHLVYMFKGEDLRHLTQAELEHKLK